MVDCISSIGKKWVKRVDAVSVLALLILSACAGCIHQEEGSETATAMEDYFRGDFITTGEPILNQEVEILFSIKPVLEAPNTTISVYLPEGIELVHGDIHWEGDIQKDEVVQITFTVKPVQEGQLILWSYVESVFFQ